MKITRTMQRTTLLTTMTALLLVLSVAQGLTGMALSANGYALPWWTVDGGGGTSTGGGYTLGGTIGQPDAGAMTGGAYTLAGGFWDASVEYRLYLPLVLRDYQ